MAAPGDVLAGRYRLDRQVGSGAMGLVWKAWDLRLERWVAVKQLRAPAGLSGPEQALVNQRAMREARINARLHHRYAVPVFDVIEHDGQPCLIMQFISSVPLAAVLREGGPLSHSEAARVGAQVASALAAAHEVGIVHRDVKPGNILVTDDGSALISDFGISHALGDATLTDTGMVHGTPAYLSPEVARGGEAGYASDVFSLGATLYAALEGTPPFGSDANSIVLLHRVAAGRFDPPQRSGALTPLLVSMLSTSPADRPTMSAAARALDLLSPPGSRKKPAAGPTPAAGPDLAAAEALVPTVSRTPRVPDKTAVELVPPGGGRPRARRRIGGAVAGVAALAVLVLVATLLLRDPGGTVIGVEAPGATPSASSPPPPSRSPSPSTASASRPAAQPSPVSAPTSRTTPTPTPAPKKPKPTAVKGKVSDSDLARAIRNYYALLPANTDAAWPGMTNRYQTVRTGGRRSYEAFWRSIRRVSTSNVTGAAPDRAEATITYEFRDGRRVRERTSFRLVKSGGRLKISDSTVLTSN